jgi:hypothetical protein
VLYSAILAHYVSDGHVPLHAVVNLRRPAHRATRLHSRWEAELFERNRAKLKVAPAPMKPILNPRDFMFETLLVSNRAAANVLESDKKAAEGREFYDDATSRRSAAGTLQVIEKRLNDSIAAVAAMITGAWEQAGRPAIRCPRDRRELRARFAVQTSHDGCLPGSRRSRSLRVLLRGRGTGRDRRAG